MSYCLEAQESVACGITRIVYEQIDGARAGLADPERRDEGVHDARKRMKKVRAVLRLVRDELGAEVYDAENRFFRDTARQLSDLRDSFVYIETVDKLAQHVDDPRYAEVIVELRTRLLRRHEALVAHAVDGENRVGAAAAALETARERVAGWPLERDGFPALRGGLQRVYRGGRRRLARAEAEPSDEHLHDWRKRVKDLWYHTRLLHPLWPGLMERQAQELRTLSEYLGDDHDLAVLRALLLAEPSLCSGAPHAFLRFIRQRRAALQAEAFALGHRIYAEKPSAFTDRLGVYWKVWKHTSNGRLNGHAAPALAEAMA